MKLKPEFSRRLYDQNCKKHRIERHCSCKRNVCVVYRKLPTFKRISITWEFVEKYIIVELVVNGKHFHGLTAKSDREPIDNANMGIAIAYGRAFKAMIGVKS